MKIQSNRLVHVHGISMRPYLRNHDLLWVQPLEQDQLYPGMLVYGVKNENGEAFVHRVISTDLIKGDRTKQPDNDLPEGVTILGVVKGRVISQQGSTFFYVSYENRWMSSIHRLQAAISRLNQWKYPLIHKIATATLIVLGTSTRKFEEHFMEDAFMEDAFKETL